MNIKDLSRAEYDEYTSYYMDLVPPGNFHEELEKSKLNVITFFQAIPPEKQHYQYAENKWTIKDILQHMIDVERIFAYRALRFAREETVALPGFEVDDYANVAEANQRSMADLIEDFRFARTSTQALFKSFTPKMLEQKGIASENIISVRAAGFKLIGHDMHHCKVISERYLD